MKTYRVLYLDSSNKPSHKDIKCERLADAISQAQAMYSDVMCVVLMPDDGESIFFSEGL